MTGSSRRATLTGPAGLAAIGVSIAATFTVAVCGTSIMEPPFPGQPGQPPWAVTGHLSPFLAVALAGGGLAIGTLGLGLTLAALRRGWAPSPRALVLGGLIAAAALTCVPPFGSSDPLSYAAYGRMLVTGHNPYTTTPDALAALGDPVARAVEDWAGAPSDYGVLATGGQAFASLLAGSSARLTVFILAVLNLAAFAATGLLLHRMTRGRPDRQARAALLWTCNPLLLQVLVSGGHVDSQAVVFAVAAVAVLRPGRGARTAAVGCPSSGTGGSGRVGWRRLVVAGALVGLGFAVKVTTALVGLGLAVAVAQDRWPRDAAAAARRRWGDLVTALAGLGVGFLTTAVPALLLGGAAYLHDLGRASDMASIGSPWRSVRSALRLAVGETTAEDLVKAGAVILLVILATLLLRGLVHPGDRRPDTTVAAASARAAFAFGFAWLLAWPYLLPWYDALGWALLPLLAASSVDGLLLAGTAALAFGYLPARAAGVVIPPGLDWLRSVVRTAVTPAALAVVIGWLVVAMIRAARAAHVLTDPPPQPAETVRSAANGRMAP